MSENLKLVVAGAGLVGQRHIKVISQLSGVELVAIVDPEPSKEFGVPCFSTLEDMFEKVSPDGVILSTPTPLHISGGLRCINQRCPVLIEKPLSATVEEARILTAEAIKMNTPILVGHHRRHNPIIQKAASMIKDGMLGDVRAVQATCWFYKPDDYFEIAPWRKKKGAGPISVNLVHDIDLLRYFCGEVVTVQAQMAPSLRGFENEDLAAAVLRFESGAIATISVSDSVVAPWSWEMTSREYPIYPQVDESCYLIGGSKASLSVPDLALWSHPGKRSWWEPISATQYPRPNADPLFNQIDHFCDVIRGNTSPLVSGEEGLKTMIVLDAIQRAAESQELVKI